MSSTPQPVAVELALPGEIALGAPLPVTLRLANRGDAPVTLYLHGRPIAFDLTIAREDGTAVWRRLERAVITAILQVRELAPGKTLVFEDRWDQRDGSGQAVAPGTYEARGAVLTDGAPLVSEPVRFRIVP